MTGWLALQGLAVAGLGHIFLIFMAVMINRQNWPGQWAVNAYCFSGFLSLSFYLPPVVLVLLLSLGLMATTIRASVLKSRDFWENLWSSFRTGFDAGKRKWILLALGLLFVLVDGIYAAFPFYRPDQWNYHLLIPKLVVLFGPLRQLPVYFDHLFFSGTWEYLFIPLRMLASHDTVFQSAVKFFNWAVLLIFCPAIFYRFPGLPGPKNRGLFPAVSASWFCLPWLWWDFLYICTAFVVLFYFHFCVFCQPS